MNHSTGKTNRSSSLRTEFPVEARADGIPQPWGFTVQDEFEHRREIWDIANQLFTIPVKPLPCPLVEENEDWRETMNISGMAFADTWEAYLRILRHHGEILYSEFEQPPDIVPDEYDLPRAIHAIRIVTRLPESVNTGAVYLWTTIFGDGEVYCRAMDERSHTILHE